MSGPIDPVERLRAESRRADGSALEPDQLDDGATLAEVVRRTAGMRPGEQTRRRHQVRLGAAGVTLAVAAVTGIAVVPGLLVPGAATPPAAVPRSGEPQSGEPTATATAQARPRTATAVMAAYVQDARSAVEQEVAGGDYVLREDLTDVIQHPGEAEDPMITRQFTAGDGSATRWVMVRDWEVADVAPMTGQEEVKHVDPDGPRGTMTYWWVAPEQGIYTTFPLTVEDYVEDDPQTRGDDGVDPVQDQLLDQLDEVRGTLDRVEALADDPAVAVGEPSAWERDGVAASCVTLTGDQPTGDIGFGAMDPATVDWSWRICFDDATKLPLLSEASQHYLLEDATEPSFQRAAHEYWWLPLDDTSRQDLEPSIDGLTEVGKDEYVDRTS